VRIAVVSNLLPPEGKGGAEAYAALVASSLAEHHDVLVLSGSGGGDVSAPVAAVPTLRELADDAALPKKLVWHARDQWRPSVHAAVARQLREFAPDVVHTHAVQGLSAAVFTAISRSGVPHVHTAHDLSLICARTSMTRDRRFCGGQCASCRVQRAVRGSAFKRHITTLLAVSDYIRRRHTEYGVVDPDHATVLRLGSGARGLRPRRVLDDGSLHLGFLGKLAANKGILTLVDMFRDAPPSWRLTIAGTGPLTGRIEAAAHDVEGLRYLGHVSGEAKEAFFDEIDVLAIPSEWEEPAALVGTEAVARGIPLLVSDRGGLPELPEARVFTSCNVDSLRASADWFTEVPERIGEISKRLIARHDEFSWTTHMAKLESHLAAAAATAAP
jgi:glycogen(starch) synthase